jgi:L-fucose mutarotase
MLKGIAPCVSPDLLKTLAEMGHGDEIVLADAHFPEHSMNAHVLRADGLGIATLLDGILPIYQTNRNTRVFYETMVVCLSAI